MLSLRIWPSLLICTALVASVGAGAADSKTKTTEKNMVLKNYGKLPLSFEINEGQTDSKVRFLARGQGYQLFLEPTASTLSLPIASDGADNAERRYSMLRMKLVGANAKAKTDGLDKQVGVSNYLKGNDRSKWRTGIANFGKVKISSAYPGIDVVYYGNQRKVEHDFVVAPGANPEKIRVAFEGAKDLKIDRKGDLSIATKYGSTVQLTRPIAYQIIKGKRVSVKGDYKRIGKDQIGFKLAAYDKRHTLTIDPVVILPTLIYSRFVGGTNLGNGNTEAFGIAIDSSGNAYVTGSTADSTFVTMSPFQTYNAGTDVFVTKINSTGTLLVYSTLLGGSSFDQGNGIAVDSTGQAYVTGVTHSNTFPVMNSYSNTRAGEADAFLTVLNAAGSALVYSSYFGGSSYDIGNAVAVTANGSAYITGLTASTGLSPFPTTAGVYQPALGGSQNAFIAKINTTASGVPSLIYSTYLGGSGFDSGHGIAVDFAGNAIVTGRTNSTNFPTSASAFQGSFGGGAHDAFLVKINTIATALLYGSYYGGNGDDRANAVALGFGDQAFVTGSTTSTNFPVSFEAFQSSLGGTGAQNAFVGKFNLCESGLFSLVYSTYLGGTGTDAGNGISVDSSDGAIVVGTTTSTDFPTIALSYTYQGAGDVFLSRLNAPGTALSYSTYFGGSGSDNGQSVVVDSNGSAYITGYSHSATLPGPGGTLISNPDPSFYEAFVAKFFGTAPVNNTYFYEVHSYERTHAPYTRPITLHDRFTRQEGVRVRHPTNFGIPIQVIDDVDETTYFINDTTAHFVNYRVEPPASRYALVTTQDEITFLLDVGSLQVELYGGTTLMVPAIELRESEDPTTIPLKARQHYRCYDVNAATAVNSAFIDLNGEFINPPSVMLADNELPPGAENTISLIKPKQYCVGVKVSGRHLGLYDSDISSVANNLMCYEAVRTAGGSTYPAEVNTLDEFGPGFFRPVNHTVLCVPSVITAQVVE